jgi:hypothetical protein
VSPLQRIRADLTERRLWPIVLLLVVALVAVPVVLRPDAGDPAAAAPSAPATPPAAEAPSPAATMAAVTAVLEGTETSKTRGTRRDPFAAPAGAKATAKAAAAATAGKSAAPASASAPASGSGSSSGSSSTRSAPAPASSSAGAPKTAPREPAAEPATAGTTYRLRRADIRFDDADVAHDAIRLRAFPSPKRPVALYLGATVGGKAAAFVITTEAEVSGDGTCKPRKRLCTHLLLKPGEEATLTVGATQHTLRLLRIRTDKTTSARVAERFYTRESSKGRCVLDILDYVAFDAETGTVAPHDDADRCRYVITEASADGAEPRTVGAR